MLGQRNVDDLAGVLLKLASYRSVTLRHGVAYRILRIPFRHLVPEGTGRVLAFLDDVNLDAENAKE